MSREKTLGDDLEKQALIRELDQEEFWKIRLLTERDLLILKSRSHFKIDFEVKKMPRWTQLEFDF